MRLKDDVRVRDLLHMIETKYPKGSAKVDPDFVREMVMRLEPWVVRTPSGIERIQDIYRRANAKRGITAMNLHSEIRSLLSRLDAETISHTPDSSIARLERQLHDLRNIVTSPPDIDRKFRDLQEQLESIREDVDGSRAALSDKQEDMLQKFLSSPKKAFIIMPFQRDFDNVWFGGIKPACSECHYAPLRVDEVNLSSLITDDIERYSNMADVVVVDLTGNNPNVMFELGWSLAKNKKPIVICQGDHSSKVAFDVRGIRHISYENSWLGVETLKKKMKDFIVTTEKQPGAKVGKKRKSAAKSDAAAGKSE